MTHKSKIKNISYNVLNNTLSSDTKFKTVFKKTQNLAPFLSEILGVDITPEMIEYLDSENLSHG